MKKLLKNFAILTVFACGLFTGCNNDAEEIDLNVNVTVSTDTPSLDEPKPLSYGVLLTWRATQDSNIFRVTRQANGGEEKILKKEWKDNRCLDSVDFNNVLEEGVEYTYRVYNLGGDNNYTDNAVVKYSYAEKKITLAEGSLKKQGEKLDAVKDADVKTSFKNGHLKINFLNDENFVWGREFVVRDAETGRKIESSYDKYDYYSISAQKVNVEITNVDNNGYYADSDVVTIKDIENTVAESIEIFNFKATEENKTVVLQWTTEEKVEASEFTIQRAIKLNKNNYDDYSNYEVLKLTPVCEEKYDGTYCWKAIDETVAVGMSYKYQVMTDDDDKESYVDVSKDASRISSFTATLRDDKTVVLLWTTEEKVEASEFTIQRTSSNSSKPEILKITPTYEEKYDGTYYWKAIDESVESGMRYEYTVITDYNSDSDTVTVPGNIEITDVAYSNVDNAVILKWKAEEVSDFKIYRADDLYGDEYKNYDLYKSLTITAEKVDTCDDGYIVYTAKDTTVEKDKDYTYRITSKDGVSSYYRSVSTGATPSVSGNISLDLYLNGSYVDDNSYESISNKTDEILLSFNNGDKNVTYKGYYTIVDNKGNESARTSFDFTKDNDSHYRKTYNASAIKDYDKAVYVNFYVKCYDGDKLLSHANYLGEYVYEYTKTLKVDPSLTTYTTFDIRINYDYYDSKYDYNNNYYYEVYHVSSKQIAIEAYGYNLDTKAITVTYFKNDGEVKTPTLTWAKVTGYDNRYTATLKVDETGDYTICATIPKDNAYNQNSYSWSKTTYVTVDE